MTRTPSPRLDRPVDASVSPASLPTQHVLELPHREALSLISIPTLDPAALGGTSSTAPTTTSPDSSTTSSVPTSASSLPVVSKLDPSKLSGIII